MKDHSGDGEPFAPRKGRTGVEGRWGSIGMGSRWH